MADVLWVPRTRNYADEKLLEVRKSEITDNHPLKGGTVTVTESKIRRIGHGSAANTLDNHANGSSKQAISSVLDPLSQALEGSDPLSKLSDPQIDPLSSMAAEISINNMYSKKKTLEAEKGEVNTEIDETFEPWSSKRPMILAKFTTSEKLSITTSFLSGGEKAAPKAQTTVSDKVKHRLEQLDDFEEGSVQEMLNLSQQDYMNRIDELNSALISAWNQDQRVKSLKIAIQCAKLLADVSVIQFYPSKFVLVTDILETFGRLVFDRIKTKAQMIVKGGHAPLPDNFTPDQVPDSAKETCRNWFFKIASIRELIPRFFVETAILRCYSFLTTGEYNQALRRLALMIRGIGDPLVAVYARCYLCRVGISVAPSIRDHLMMCFDDYLFTYKQIQADSVQNQLALQKLELANYLILHSPALDWLLQCIAHKASNDTMGDVLKKAHSKCNSALLLNSIMSAFQPEYISIRATDFTTMIRECEDTGFPKHLLYRSLGTCLVLADPPEEHRLTLLNEVWKVVMKLKNPPEYMACAEVWVEYVIKHFTKKEVNTILGDIIKHVTPDRAFEDHYGQLQSVMSKVLTHSHDFSQLFSMDKYLPFLDLFQKEQVKVEVCKNIMESYIRNQTEATNDPVILSTLMYICKTMHDSVNALTLDDEIRQIGNLIIGFLRSISFNRDFEQQLSFYVEARGSFSNIDLVLIYLIQSVNRLAMETRSIVKGNHSRKTSSFVRACAAFSFISIPSLKGIFSRLHLYLQSGQVALLNQCLSQVDANLKEAVALITEVPRTLEIDNKMKTTEPLLLDFIQNLAATLLLVPDDPGQGVLYLLRGLLNILESYNWDSHNDSKAKAYISVLVMLSAARQESYLHHIEKVDSNDLLYGSDAKFHNEIDGITKTLLDQILAILKSLEKPETQRRQATLALELFNITVAHGDLTRQGIQALAVNLWNLAQRYGQLDTKLMLRSLDYVKRRAKSTGRKDLAELASSLPVQTRT